MQALEYLDKFKDNQVCTVNDNPVWDYKMEMIVDHLELRLISEPVPGSEKYEQVTCSELRDFVGIWTNSIVVDETTGNEVNSI